MHGSYNSHILLIPQDSHKLPTCESGSSGHDLFGILHTKDYFELFCFHSPRGGGWKSPVHITDRQKCGSGRSHFLDHHAGCHRNRALLCRGISTWKQRETNYEQTEGVLMG